MTGASERAAARAARRDSWLAKPLGATGALRVWLMDRGSLTSRLKSACGDFRVAVLREGRVRGAADEAPLFGVDVEYLHGRDVLLFGGGVPLVYAHSVLRTDHLRGPWRALSALGTRPLGAALFADPRVVRHALRYRRLVPGHPLYCAAREAALATSAPLWARRSLFCLHGAPLLVTEVFLPVQGSPWFSYPKR